MGNSNITRRKFLDRVIRGGICVSLGYPVVVEPNWPLLEHETGTPSGPWPVLSHAPV